MSKDPTFGPSSPTVVFHRPAPDKQIHVNDVTRNLYGMLFSLRALGSVLNADPILVEHSDQVLNEAEEAFTEHDTVVHELGRKAASRFLHFAVNHFAELSNDAPEETTQPAVGLLIANLEVINDNVNRTGYTFRERQTAAAATKSALNNVGVMISRFLPIAREQTVFADFESRGGHGACTAK